MRLTQETITYITLFENVTGAKVKDCIPEEDGLLFIIEEGNIQKALKGKRRVEHLLKKEVHLLAYSDDLTKFIKNMIYPIQAEIVRDQNTILIHTENTADRGKIYGRGRERLEKITLLVKRYFTTIEMINVK